MNLDQLRTLVVIADTGSFERAAVELHVSAPALSQRIKALEKELGFVLLHRSTPCRTTERGGNVLRYARQVLDLEEELLAGESGHRRITPVSVAVNADSLATWFLPVLADLGSERRYRLRLRSVDQGHSRDLLARGEVMAAVSSDPDPVPGCRVERLGSMRYLPAAAPQLAAELSGGLDDAPVVVFDEKDDLHRQALDPGAPRSGLEHQVPSSELVLASVLAGIGWGMLPAVQAEPALERGALVLLDTPRTLEVPLYWHRWKVQTPALDDLAAAVRAAAASALGEG